MRCVKYRCFDFRYLKKLESVQSLPEVVKDVEMFKPLMQALSHYTGKNITNTNQMYYLYHDLMAEKSMNLSLPKWTRSLFPYGSLWEATILEYDIVSYNDELKRLNGGKNNKSYQLPNEAKKLLEYYFRNATEILSNDLKLDCFVSREKSNRPIFQELC